MDVEIVVAWCEPLERPSEHDSSLAISDAVVKELNACIKHNTSRMVSQHALRHLAITIHHNRVWRIRLPANRRSQPMSD